VIHRRLALRAPLLAAVAAASAAAGLLTGCGGSGPDKASDGTAGSGKPQELLLVSYAVTKGAYDRILPRFEAEWQRKTGQTVKVRASYGGSGSQTRAILDGLEGDVATLALAGDVLKLQKAGLVDPGWEKEQPNGSIITNSVVAFLPRAGNPKGVKNWPDLARPDVKVITANPKTSGGARWNFLGLWGSVTQTGGSEEQARRYVTSVYRNVETLPKDAREATDTFLKRGQGDILLNYENEAILARKVGELKGDFVVPSTNILIEGPVAVIDRNVERRGTRKAAEGLAAWLSSEEAQRVFAEEGFRPVHAGVWAKVRASFAPVTKEFRASDFGGWETIERTFFGKSGGLWDELFRSSR
jgi:sulfate transport system substrate-binding protein